MDTCKVIQVIETTLTRRGDGKNSPVRVITQYWSMDGQLLWEKDPYELCESVSED
ncbi:carboxypeptidase [Paenibacillus ottowii]|uniref:Carboxypeptidase n=1 Tax=Paenibacillus ottowii TaxID=2315729 RepID=A0ABY3B397_9BACL|nr:carboxypeptidase [Paenibacillus ottowii]TQR97323.1 carboxypeptidase [Paenibacillus ottowii]